MRGESKNLIFGTLGAILFMAVVYFAIWGWLELTEPEGMEYRFRPVSGQYCVSVSSGGYYCAESLTPIP